MKETKKMNAFWKRDVQWDKMSVKQKAIAAWFSLSFVFMGFCGESLLLTIASVANFALASYSLVRNVPMEDE